MLEREGQMTYQGVGRPGSGRVIFMDVAVFPHGGSGLGDGAVGAKRLDRRDAVVLRQPLVSDPVGHLISPESCSNSINRHGF